MPKLLRPDIVEHYRGCPDAASARDKLLWPYIDEKALTTESILLVLLSARGNCHPYEFISTDRKWADFGVLVGDIPVQAFPEYIIFARNSYGKVIHSIGKLTIDDYQILSLGDGLLALEIQEHLYKFLLDCCEKLLSGDPSTAYPEGYEPVESEVLFTEGCATVPDTPYRRPASFDFRRLFALVDAKYSAAEEHLRDLRADPGYFARALLEVNEHHPERLKHLEDILSERSSLPRSRPGFDKNKLWNKTIFSVISDAFADVCTWKEIQQQLNVLDKLLQQEQKLRPGQNIPVGLEYGFSKLISSLERLCRYFLIKTQRSLHSSPQMRRFSCQFDYNGQQQIGATEDFLKDKKRKQFMEVICCLYKPGIRFWLGLPSLMDALDGIIQDNSIKGLLSPYVMEVISELSVVAECLREIDFFQPWATLIRDKMPEKAVDLDQNWHRLARKWIVLNRDQELNRGQELDFARLGTPTGSRFLYPADKPRTLRVTQAMQKAEANLDKFWDMVKDKIERYCETLPAPDDRPTWALILLNETRVLQRTPDWAEPTSSIKPGPPSASAPQSELAFELQYRTQLGSSESGPPSHYRRKARSPAARPTEIPAVTPPRQEPKVQRISIADDEDLEVFDFLFHTPSASSLPGEIGWKRFLSAMGSAGFNHHKLTGSVYQFIPRWDRRNILFHGPHPGSKLKFYSARHIGRRLSRVYGLSRDSFGSP